VEPSVAPGLGHQAQPDGDGHISDGAWDQVAFWVYSVCFVLAAVILIAALASAVLR
jgi:hypothetical protein